MSFLFPNTNAVAQCLPHMLPNCYTDEFHDVLSIVSRDNPERLVIFADWALLVPETRGQTNETEEKATERSRRSGEKEENGKEAEREQARTSQVEQTGKQESMALARAAENEFRRNAKRHPLPTLLQKNTSWAGREKAPTTPPPVPHVPGGLAEVPQRTDDEKS
ncbi:hypothetical protein Cadr_000022375 [Camelus dromedarius]|uniref:Uncharacterized protein n=1 Tax=Camelus dromedarius TaxID=9838 RepID=A0A5N4CTE0_CAMDR|nr:hypothetical protein Cadr_000022375 [Camelus dromedarius]